MPTASTADSAPDDLLRAHRVECIAALTAGTAHGLNNHLAALVMLLDALEPDLPARQAKTAGWLREGIERSLQAIRQMEWLARSGTSDPLLYQPLYVVKDVANLLRAAFSPEIAVAEDDPYETCLVDGDPTLLHQVLLAVSLDAAAALTAGGELALRLRSAPAAEAGAGPDLQVDVDSRPAGSDADGPDAVNLPAALRAALVAQGGRISAHHPGDGWRRVRLQLPSAGEAAIRSATQALGGSRGAR